MFQLLLMIQHLILGFKNRLHIENYIKTYLDLMGNYYSINQLTINKSKTKFTTIGNAQQIAETKGIKIKIGEEFIICDGNVRILGTLISSDNTLNAAINELVSNLNFRYAFQNIVD